jgi:hypothetical protein
MNQSKYWRFNIGQNQGSGQSGSTGSSTSGSSGQSNQSGQAFLIVEANDEQTAIQQVRQLLQSDTSSQNLGTPTQVNEQAAQQLTRQPTTV